MMESQSPDTILLERGRQVGVKLQNFNHSSTLFLALHTAMEMAKCVIQFTLSAWRHHFYVVGKQIAPEINQLAKFHADV